MKKIGELKPCNLLAGHMHVVKEDIILEQSESIYKKGSVLAKKANGKCVLVDSATDDKDVYAILPLEIDATEDHQVAPGWLTGEFNQNYLVFGGADDFEQHIESARKVGIFFKESSAPAPAI